MKKCLALLGFYQVKDKDTTTLPQRLVEMLLVIIIIVLFIIEVLFFKFIFYIRIFVTYDEKVIVNLQNDEKIPESSQD